MPFEPLNDKLVHKHERKLSDFERSLGLQPSSHSKQQPQKPPDRLPTVHFLSDVSSQPLSWLWPGRIPLGHLTLLDGAPGSGLSLFALTLAACVSSGSPLPDGTPTQQGNVILLAPYDSPSDTLKPRLEAAGGDPAHVLLLHPLVENASHTLSGTRSFALPQDLDFLASTIRALDARLVILDPASATPGLSRCLPALIQLAHQTNCAILLTRSLRELPADPLHSPGPPSPLLEAARSRLLLASDPGDERHYLLLTTRHPLCSQPTMLAYHILSSEAGIPTIHWLGERDRFQLTRLSTGPIRSPHRQAILHFLHNSASPQRIPDILEATSSDREAGRKMLVRMTMAGELVSPARGLYTTPNHPCLAHFPDDAPPVPIVPPVPPVPDTASPSVSTVPIVSSPQSSASENSSQSDVPTVPDTASPSVSTVPSPASENSSQSDVPPLPDTPDEPTETSVGAEQSCLGAANEGTSPIMNFNKQHR